MILCLPPAADFLYMIPHHLSLLCVIDNIIVSRLKCELHCEQFTISFRLLTCEAAAVVTVSYLLLRYFSMYSLFGKCQQCCGTFSYHHL